jgi:hypothetical protein
MALLTLVAQYGITVKEKGSAGFKKERRNVYPPNQTKQDRTEQTESKPRVTG